MSLIKNLIPTNLAAEENAFWAHDGDYNPQFTYEREYPLAVLMKYGQASSEQFARARRYLDTHPFTPAPAVQQPLGFEELEAMLTDLCGQLQIATIPLVRQPGQTSRFMIRSDGVMSLRWPAKVSREQFTGVLNHEVQTHWLRRLNDQRQPWHADKSRRNALWKKTEEGLAIYNSKDKNDPDLRQAALLYELVYWAQVSDFKTVYRQNLNRIGDKRRAFTNTLRVKRGLRDTSQPGGFTKDLVYWEGYHEVAAYLAQPGHSLCDLYWGKIGVAEVEKLRAQAVVTGLVYPTFAQCRLHTLD